MNRKSHVIVGILIFILLGFGWNAPGWACFNPLELFAVEVLLNKPGITYSLDLLRRAENVTVTPDQIVYRAHFNPDVVVILSAEEEMRFAEAHLRGGLDLRLQIPVERADRPEGPDLRPAVGLDPKTFPFGTALRIELEWLSEQRILFGLDETDLTALAEQAKAGLAGWNSRLVYSQGKWVPYYDSEAPVLLREKAFGCGNFDLGIIPEGRIQLGNAAAVRSLNKLAVTWGDLKKT